MKKLLSALLIFSLLISAFSLNVFSAGYDGKTVVLYTGNIRGDVDVLSQITAVKAQYEADGADVILIDVGNYLQGTIYTTYDSGEKMVSLMSAAGYDIVGIGSHEFAFGNGTVGVEQHEILYQDGTLGKFLADASFTVISANIITKDGNLNAYAPNITIDGIGFFGLTDQWASRKVIDSNISGFIFNNINETIAQQSNELSACDVIIGISNAGNVVADDVIMIDISSEEEFTIGAIIIDNETKTVTEESVTLSSEDADMKSAIDEYKAIVDAEYPSVIVAKSAVTLNGSQKDVRSIDTNLGNLWTDALVWFAAKGGLENYIEEDDIAAGNTEVIVDDDHIVGLWNGGNLRDYINTGDVTLKDLQRVLPYPNKAAVVYLTGAQLLEFLEAAAQGLPYTSIRHGISASFMQVSGIEYTIAANVPYDSGELYRPNWYKANSVNRVTIDSINGNDMVETDVYAVITSNANYNGMDASYVCLDKGDESLITTASVYDVVMMYILQELNGVIDDTYAEPQGRITIENSTKFTYSDVSATDWYAGYVDFVTANGYMNGVTYDTFAPDSEITRGEFINLLYRMAGYPSVEVVDRFTDVPAESVYARAVEWAVGKGITNGATESTFEPDELLTQQQMAVMLYRYNGSPEVEGEVAFEDVSSWAENAVIYFVTSGLSDGIDGFMPKNNATRAIIAAVLANI